MNEPIKVACYHGEGGPHLVLCDLCMAWQAYFDRQWEVLNRLTSRHETQTYPA